MSLELLLKQIDIQVQNAEVIRENFRRIKQYLDEANVGQIQNIKNVVINEVQNMDFTAFNRMESFTVATNGQTVFNLLEIPINPNTSTALFINTAKMIYGVHYTILDNVVTFDPVGAGFALEVSNEFGQPDNVVIYYAV